MKIIKNRQTNRYEIEGVRQLTGATKQGIAGYSRIGGLFARCLGLGFKVPTNGGNYENI